MTTTNLMSLPVDIAWKRLALDDEMMSRPFVPISGQLKIGRIPPCWNPSVTIFYARPQPEFTPEEYMDNIITYLKVVCSVTGTTLLPPGLSGSPWEPETSYPLVQAEINDTLALYYGCYGAMLAVTVEPYAAAGVPIEEYPYFIDFQPKKREIYESVTLSGEILADSKESLGIRKSGTSTFDQEVAGGALPHTVPERVSKGQVEFSDIRNIDASREYRETLSHTTNLSQLYHQLNSYHLGTNRALFFLQPRPHIADPKYQPFVWGPRRLEGIQEFFFVVTQPKSRPGLCVSAGLKTGHFAFNKITEQAETPEERPQPGEYWHLRPIMAPETWPKQHTKEQHWLYSHFAGATIGTSDPTVETERMLIDEGWILNDAKPEGEAKTWEQVKGDNHPVMQGPGWSLEIDKTRSDVNLIKFIKVQVCDAGLIVSSQISGKTGPLIEKGGEYAPDKYGDDIWGEVYAKLTLYLKTTDLSSVFPEGREEIDFFVRYKTVGACLDDKGQIHSQPKETYFLDKQLNKYDLTSGFSYGNSSGKLQSVRELNERIIEAMKDADDVVSPIYGPGPVSNPLHTNFVVNLLRNRLSKVDNQEWLSCSVEKMDELSNAIKQRCLKNGIETRAQLLDIPLDQLQKMFGLTKTEAHDLYLTAWDIPSQLQQKGPESKSRTKK